MPHNPTTPTATAQAAGTLQPLLQRAIDHHQHGRLHEAEALYGQILQADTRHADALHLLGVIALQRGQPDAAAALIQRAIAIRPADNFCCNLGNALKQQGRRSEAIVAYRQAVELNSNLAEAWCNLGDAVLQAGDVDEAVACCRRAIQLQPGFAEAHCNLGNAMLRQGQADQAVACYHQALRLQPRLAAAHGNLGRALQARGLADQALACYRQALTLGPASADLHARVGGILLQQGRLAPAIDAFVLALHCDDRNDIRAGFVQAVKTAQFQAPQPQVRALIIRALQEAWADTGDLLTPATSLIEANPSVREALGRTQPTRLDQPLPVAPALLAAIAQDELLRLLLETDTVNSIGLEGLLTALRRQLLEAAVTGTGAADEGTAERPKSTASSAAVALLHAALARQCFINEYVYACSAAERLHWTQLQARLNACWAAGTLPAPHWLVASAAYAPLSRLAGAAGWSVLRWDAALVALFRQQVIEPATEAALRPGIRRLTAIEDRVSRLVQDQYEAHPYPRWMQLPQGPEPATIDTVLRQQWPVAQFHPFGAKAPLEVLVAGCGTGQHSIQVARQFKDARVLAIDLSLASLAYARRKTDEAGLTNIDHAQADILQLGELEQRFDLIEASGVLHHLADPLAGWQVLVDLLRPGGFMVLGFYSELGRRDVVAARRLVAEQGLAAQAHDISACRQTLMAPSLSPQFEGFLSSRDFYSTSACRDLLFHVHEHRYTLLQLQGMLQRLGLDLVGLMLDPVVIAAYAALFPDDPAMCSLEHWHAFETSRPSTFSRMYQFCVQRPPQARHALA